MQYFYRMTNGNIAAVRIFLQLRLDGNNKPLELGV